MGVIGVLSGRGKALRASILDGTDRMAGSRRREMDARYRLIWTLRTWECVERDKRIRLGLRTLGVYDSYHGSCPVSPSARYYPRDGWERFDICHAVLLGGPHLLF